MLLILEPWFPKPLSPTAAKALYVQEQSPQSGPVHFVIDLGESLQQLHAKLQCKWPEGSPGTYPAEMTYMVSFEHFAYAVILPKQDITGVTN